MRREDPIFDDDGRASEAPIRPLPELRTRTFDGFRDCYEAHLRELIGFASSRVGRVEAEDLVAETFARAWRSMPADLHTGEGSARPWLFRVLRNLMTDRGRNRGVAERAADRIRHHQPTWQDDETAQQSDRDELRRALARLPDRQRLVLELRFAADLDATETGNVLGLNTEAVRALTYRAMKSLREILVETEHAATQRHR